MSGLERIILGIWIVCVLALVVVFAKHLPASKEQNYTHQQVVDSMNAKVNHVMDKLNKEYYFIPRNKK